MQGGLNLVQSIERVRALRKFILVIPVLLLFISGAIYIGYKEYRGQVKESDLIIEVNKDSLTENSEESVIDYYEKNRNDFVAASVYLLENENLFRTRPVILNENMSDYIEKIEDQTIEDMVNRLLKEAMIKQIASLNDDIKNVYFFVNGEYGVYEQGIRYSSNAKTIEGDKTKYNNVRHYKDLGGGWYYYLYYYNEIKGAEDFRKLAWDMLSENDKKTVRYDWNKAIVTLVDSNTIGYKKGKTRSKFAISVCFNTEADGIMGPIIIYFDPSTKEVVGGEMRY
jgi:hypothetical protein